MKVVYYAKYFEYFEQSRSDLLRSIKIPYSEIEKKGILLPVVEAFAKYISSAKFDDLIEVESTLSEIQNTKIKINYKILKLENSNLITTGYTVHCFLDSITKKIIRVPQFFLETLSQNVF